MIKCKYLLRWVSWWFDGWWSFFLCWWFFLPCYLGWKDWALVACRVTWDLAFLARSFFYHLRRLFWFLCLWRWYLDSSKGLHWSAGFWLFSCYLPSFTHFCRFLINFGWVGCGAISGSGSAELSFVCLLVLLLSGPWRPFLWQLLFGSFKSQLVWPILLISEEILVKTRVTGLMQLTKP